MSCSWNWMLGWWTGVAGALVVEVSEGGSGSGRGQSGVGAPWLLVCRFVGARKGEGRSRPSLLFSPRLRAFAALSRPQPLPSPHPHRFPSASSPQTRMLSRLASLACRACRTPVTATPRRGTDGEASWKVG